MKVLTYDDLPQGGFAGLKERQYVKDSRMFGKQPGSPAFDGIGNFIYLADANFNPHGETRMHGHREIDVISVMAKGRVQHKGSIGHGQDLEAGQVQVQRAGAEGFSHNEINPDNRKNQLIQIWVAPDKLGERAGYKVYTPKVGEMTKIYGGSKKQNDTFYSRTSIAVANASDGDSFAHKGPVMAYLSKGSGMINGQYIEARTLVRDEKGIEFMADDDSQLILFYTSS